jgi:SAM-dependent methyltransferase
MDFLLPSTPPGISPPLEKLGLNQLSKEGHHLFARCVKTPLELRSRGEDLATSYFGMPLESFRSSVIQYGRDDFLNPFRPLNPDYRMISRVHKVLGYCFLNMRQHQIANQAIYSRYNDFTEIFFSGKRPLIIDCGCGPATAGLALAQARKDATGAPAEFTYLGVETSRAMTLRGRRFFKEAKELDDPLLTEGAQFRSTGRFGAISEAWLEKNIPTGTPVLILCSYFFGSYRGAVPEVSALVERLAKVLPGSPLGLIHTNTPNPEKNKKYQEFVDSTPTLKSVASGLAQFEYPGYRQIKAEMAFFEVLLNGDFDPIHKASGWRPRAN